MDKKLVLTSISVVYLIMLLLGATVIRLGSNESSSVPGFDKVLHFMGFFVLAFLLILTFTHYNLKKKHLVTFLVASFIGILIEIIQFIPSLKRDFSLLDWGADLAGIILALVLSWSFSRK